MAGDFFVVALEGISAYDQLDKLDVAKWASMAVNKTLTRTRAAAAKSMERQVSFPRGYLTGDNGRLSIAQYASVSSPEGIIRGRDQPTSLARFVVGGAKVPEKGSKDKGVVVMVDPGVAKRMPGAFAIRLKNNNIGLAIRSKNPPSFGAKKLGDNLYLLYGVSVDQIFRTTRAELHDDAEAFMAAEFNRLLQAGI